MDRANDDNDADTLESGTPFSYKKVFLCQH